MRGVYSHVSDAIPAELTAAWHGQSRWAASLRDRAQPASGSTVSVSDALADGAQARRRPASPWELGLRFPHARKQIHEKTGGLNWVRTSDPSLVRRNPTIAGSRLTALEVPASRTNSR